MSTPASCSTESTNDVQLYEMSSPSDHPVWLPEDDDGGHEHHHIHSVDGLMCRGDISEGWSYMKKYYVNDDGSMVMPDTVIVDLPHCIYPCWTVRRNRIDYNIAVLSAYP
jgi:hypothetical protein